MPDSNASARDWTSIGCLVCSEALSQMQGGLPHVTKQVSEGKAQQTGQWALNTCKLAFQGVLTM